MAAETRRRGQSHRHLAFKTGEAEGVQAREGPRVTEGLAAHWALDQLFDYGKAEGVSDW